MVSGGEVADGADQEEAQQGARGHAREPLPSRIWTLKCMQELLDEAPSNNYTGENLELQQLDQCQYGLKDHITGLPQQKGTELLLSSELMRLRLKKDCPQNQQHEPIIGRRRTFQAISTMA